MISAIIEYMRERKTVSLNDLMIHFEIDESAIKPILERLIAKKYINHLNLECNGCSRDCSKCSFVKDKEFYQYIAED